MCHRQQGLRGLILLVPLRLLPLLRKLPLLQRLRRYRLLLQHLLRPPLLLRLHSKLSRGRKQNREGKRHKQYRQHKHPSLRLIHRPHLSRHRPLPPQPPRPLMLPQPKQRQSQNPSLLTTVLSRPGKMLPSLPAQGSAMTLQNLPQRTQALKPVPRPVRLKKRRPQLLTAALFKPPKCHQRHPLRQPSSPLPQTRQTPLPIPLLNPPKPRARAVLSP